MKRFLLASISMLISITCSGCFYNMDTLEGNKKITSISKELAASGYSLVIRDINFGFSGDNKSKKIIIDESFGNFVTLTTDKNLLETINIDVDNSAKTITVSGDNDKFYMTDNFTLNVGSVIEDVTLDGELSVDINQPNATNFNARFSGAFEGAFSFGKLDNFSLDISGASDIKIKGESNTCNIEISGASDIDASEFKTVETDVEISGAANAKVYATEKLNAEISGVGEILYYGNPSIVNKDVAGLGSIESATNEKE